MRRTTLVEDIAYSLLGIFNAAAWTGTANMYNSCLPRDLTVYNELVPPHIPPVMEMAEVDQMMTELCSSIPDLSLPMTLHDQLNKLPSPSLASSRLRLPGIVSLVTEVVRTSGPDAKTKLCVYRVTTSFFSDVEIKTTNDLTMMNDLYLVHPWIRPLLDQEFLRAPARLDKTIQALRLVARLRQPFGGLLFEQVSRVEYKRVAADSLIMAPVREDVSSDDLMDNILTIDVQ